MSGNTTNDNAGPLEGSMQQALAKDGIETPRNPEQERFETLARAHLNSLLESFFGSEEEGSRIFGNEDTKAHLIARAVSYAIKHGKDHHHKNHLAKVTLENEIARTAAEAEQTLANETAQTKAREIQAASELLRRSISKATDREALNALQATASELDRLSSDSSLPNADAARLFTIAVEARREQMKIWSQRNKSLAKQEKLSHQEQSEDKKRLAGFINNRFRFLKSDYLATAIRIDQQIFPKEKQQAIQDAVQQHYKDSGLALPSDLQDDTLRDTVDTAVYRILGDDGLVPPDIRRHLDTEKNDQINAIKTTTEEAAILDDTAADNGVLELTQISGDERSKQAAFAYIVKLNQGIRHAIRQRQEELRQKKTATAPGTPTPVDSKQPPQATQPQQEIKAPQQTPKIPKTRRGIALGHDKSAPNGLLAQNANRENPSETQVSKESAPAETPQAARSHTEATSSPFTFVPGEPIDLSEPTNTPETQPTIGMKPGEATENITLNSENTPTQKETLRTEIASLRDNLETASATERELREKIQQLEKEVNEKITKLEDQLRVAADAKIELETKRYELSQKMETVIAKLGAFFGMNDQAKIELDNLDALIQNKTNEEKRLEDELEAERRSHLKQKTQLGQQLKESTKQLAEMRERAETAEAESLNQMAETDKAREALARERSTHGQTLDEASQVGDQLEATQAELKKATRTPTLEEVTKPAEVKITDTLIVQPMSREDIVRSMNTVKINKEGVNNKTKLHEQPPKKVLEVAIQKIGNKLVENNEKVNKSRAQELAQEFFDKNTKHPIFGSEHFHFDDNMEIILSPDKTKITGILDRRAILRTLMQEALNDTDISRLSEFKETKNIDELPQKLQGNVQSIHTAVEEFLGKKIPLAVSTKTNWINHWLLNVASAIHEHDKAKS